MSDEIVAEVTKEDKKVEVVDEKDKKFYINKRARAAIEYIRYSRTIELKNHLMVTTHGQRLTIEEMIDKLKIELGCCWDQERKAQITYNTILLMAQLKDLIDIERKLQNEVRFLYKKKAEIELRWMRTMSFVKLLREVLLLKKY